MDLGFLAVHPGAFRVDLGTNTEAAIFHATADYRAIWEPLFFTEGEDLSVALRLADVWGDDPELGVPKGGKAHMAYFLTVPTPYQYGKGYAANDQISLQLAVAPSPAYTATGTYTNLKQTSCSAPSRSASSTSTSCERP